MSREKQTDCKSDPSCPSENPTDENFFHGCTQSDNLEGCLYNERTAIGQSDGCLHDERTCTHIDQSEEHSHEERFSNPCKRKRVPSTEYLDAIDKTHGFCNYFESLPKTEKANSHTTRTNFIVNGPVSPRAERSSPIQGSICAEKSALVQGSSSSERSAMVQGSSSSERSAWVQGSSSSERSAWVQGPSSLERLPWVQGSSRTEISIKNSTIDSNNEVCDTRTECDMSHECVSSQYSSPEDNETGEDLRSFSSFSELQPNTIHSSNQSSYKDKVASTASGLDQNNIQPTTDSCYQSASESSSSSNSSKRKPFSISAATASSSSGKISSNDMSSTEADVSSSSSPSSSSSQIQNVRIPIPNPVQEFQGIIVNTYSCKTPLKKENIKTHNDGCATDLKFSINIPSYLLIQIFQHLSMYELLHNVSSVCKLWYNISHDPDLWRVIDLQNQLKVTDVVITNLTSYSDRVIYLNISDITTISEDCLVKTVTNCQHLKTLKLSRCISVTTDRLLTAIGGHCHNLRDIHMELCFRITDKGLEDLAVGCPKLESVHISQCQNVGNKGLAQLAEHCPLLDSISVDSCAKIRDEGIIALANGCSEIRIINLHSCSIGDMGAYQLKNLKFLQTLDLSGSNELSLQTVSMITQNCTKLECLNLSLKRNVDDGYIEMVARHCTQLRKLYCVSCTITDTGLEFLGRYSQRLEHLDIGWCHAVTDAGVQFVSENCPALRYIGLIRCDQVTAEGIEDLLDKYPRITYSTFILESRKIIEMARMQGFQFPANNDDGKPSVVFWDNAS